MLKFKNFERLPKNVIPSLYKLQLQPDLEKFTFSGKEDIEVTVKETTNQVIINSAEIDIQSASFKDQCGGQFEGKVTFDTVDEKAFIKFDKDLKVGNGVLSLTFTGILNDLLKGFYRTKYTTLDGAERFAATTQFEPASARFAFPCWDEPAIKAIFEVTMIAPKDRTVLSNTDPVKESQHPDNPNLKIVQFAPSPIMSTYLLAFIVGEYDYVETFTKRNTRVRVYLPPGKKHHGSFALDVAGKSLELFEDYFNIPFPLNKMDHVAIPDFATGAMENWGLVTYREVKVLVDPENTSAAFKELGAITIVHETSHQWFGNLVTMEWWTDLWLNEGFATFMEFLGTDKILPQFKVWSQFVTQATIPAMETDAYRESHPIEVPIGHPDEIEMIFDNISYQKGGSVIRMCHNWIGDEAFRKGLTNYLNKYAYGNAVTQNLWDEWEAASNKPVGKTMPTWTKQLGYPVVKVESRQDGNNRILKLEQQKFSISGILTEEEKQMTWMIPVDVITSQDPNKIAATGFMSSKTMELVVPNVAPTDWVKLNSNVTGFYRVSYSPEMLNNLKSAIYSKQLGAVDRLSIIKDLSALAISGHAETEQVLSLLESYADEDQYVTWVGISEFFHQMQLIISYTDLSDKFNSFGIKVYTKIFEKLGFDCIDADSHLEQSLRELVLKQMASFKYQPVLDESMKRFKNHLNGKPMNPDIREVIYRIVASSCDDDTFASLLKVYRENNLAEEKSRILTSIGYTNKLHLLRQVFQFAISDEVRIQDSWRCIRCSTGSRIGAIESWKFFKDNADLFRKRYASSVAANQLIEALTTSFASDEEAKDIEEFFTQNPFSGLESVWKRGVESTKAKASWSKRELNNIERFLNSV